MNTFKAATDSALLESFVSGDQQAIAELVRRYQSSIYTATYMVVRDKYVAEDILQDTFYKFIKVVMAGKYRHQDKLSGYLVRIAHNLAVDYVRRQKALPMITAKDGKDIFSVYNFSVESSLDRIERNEEKANLKWAIAQLNDKEREVVMLRYFADMSFKEIAELTNLNVNTTLGRMRRAVKSLRKHLVKQEKKYDSTLYQI